MKEHIATISAALRSALSDGPRPPTRQRLLLALIALTRLQDEAQLCPGCGDKVTPKPDSTCVASHPGDRLPMTDDSAKKESVLSDPEIPGAPLGDAPRAEPVTFSTTTVDANLPAGPSGESYGHTVMSGTVQFTRASGDMISLRCDFDHFAVIGDLLNDKEMLRATLDDLYRQRTALQAEVETLRAAASVGGAPEEVHESRSPDGDGPELPETQHGAGRNKEPRHNAQIAGDQEEEQRGQQTVGAQGHGGQPQTVNAGDGSCNSDPRHTNAHRLAVQGAGSEPADSQPFWAPIETAPKDKLIIGALIRDGRIWRIHDMKHNGLAFYTVAGGSLPHMTHWMPLPPGGVRPAGPEETSNG